jgi:hypothetical protein
MGKCTTCNGCLLVYINRLDFASPSFTLSLIVMAALFVLHTPKNLVNSCVINSHVNCARALRLPSSNFAHSPHHTFLLRRVTHSNHTTTIMPPKAPKAKPKPVPRRGAAAKPSAEEALAELSADVTAGEASSTAAPAAEPEPELPPLPIESKPIAPPKGRLDSLSSTRGDATAGGSKIKFKPRMVARKTKE